MNPPDRLNKTVIKLSDIAKIKFSIFCILVYIIKFSTSTSHHASVHYLTPHENTGKAEVYKTPVTWNRLVLTKSGLQLCFKTCNNFWVNDDFFPAKNFKKE